MDQFSTKTVAHQAIHMCQERANWLLKEVVRRNRRYEVINVSLTLGKHCLGLGE